MSAVTYSPEQTRGWTAERLDELVTQYVIAQTPPGPGFDADPLNAPLRVDSGVVVATLLKGDVASLEWKLGGFFRWPHADGVWLAVCDAHGDHQDSDGLACSWGMAKTLGVPHEPAEPESVEVAA